jgi:hypothetical protein
MAADGMVFRPANGDVFGQLAAAAGTIIYIFKTRPVINSPLDMFTPFPLSKLIMTLGAALRAFEILRRIQASLDRNRLQ